VKLRIDIVPVEDAAEMGQSMGSPLLLKGAKMGGGAIQLTTTEYGEHSAKLAPEPSLLPGSM
jgi:hypothetical protein